MNKNRIEKSLWDLIAQHGSAAVMVAWGFVLLVFIGTGIAVAEALFRWGSFWYVVTILVSVALSFLSIWTSKKIGIISGSGRKYNN